MAPGLDPPSVSRAAGPFTDPEPLLQACLQFQFGAIGQFVAGMANHFESVIFIRIAPVDIITPATKGPVRVR